MDRRPSIHAFVWVCAVILLAAACNNQPTVSVPTAVNSPLQSPVGQTTAPASTSTPVPGAGDTGSTSVVTTSTGAVVYSGGKGQVVFAYDTNGSGYFQIGLVNLSTGELKTLTTSPEPGDAEPHWSPDGKTIYFTSSRDPAEGYVIYRMNADGSKQTPVIRVPGRNTINSQASVNSSNNQIVFHSNRDGNMEIYVANTDGTSERNLTQNPANDVTASWSPDGSKIIFASDRVGNEYQVFTMNSDGSNVIQLIKSPGALNYSPKYSPDGKRVVFLTRPSGGGNPQIVVADADGSNIRVVTNGFDMHAKVGWADDNTIIYTSRVSDSLPWTIYMLNLETHLRTRLISGPVSYTDPDWTSK